jgi:hypothetical protein
MRTYKAGQIPHSETNDISKNFQNHKNEFYFEK